jgi:hypothetical protein
MDTEGEWISLRRMINIWKRINYIFPVLILVLIAGLVVLRIYQTEVSSPEPEIQISDAEASDYIGTAAEVCGQVAGEPIFLNLGQAYPNQSFTAVIWGNNRDRWTVPPEKRYASRSICINGVIEQHVGTPGS